MSSLAEKESDIYSKFIQANRENGWIAYAIYKQEQFELGLLPDITQEDINQYINRAVDFKVNLYADRIKALEYDEKKYNFELRKKYAARVSWIVVGWLAFVMFVLFVYSINCFQSFLKPLDNNVLIALIGGSSVNIIGLFAIVLKYLFPDKI